MDSQHLTACLILYQQRRDGALGIGWPPGGQALKGLLWYYRKQQQQTANNIITAAELNGIIQSGAAEIKRLVTLAETSDDKHAIARQVLELKTKVNEAAIQLEAMASPSGIPHSQPGQLASSHSPAQTGRNRNTRQRLKQWLQARR